MSRVQLQSKGVNTYANNSYGIATCNQFSKLYYFTALYYALLCVKPCNVILIKATSVSDYKNTKCEKIHGGAGGGRGTSLIIHFVGHAQFISAIIMYDNNHVILDKYDSLGLKQLKANCNL